MARILHVTTCYAGGVSRAIETAVKLTPEHDHHILWSGSEEPPLASYKSVTKFEGLLHGYVPAVEQCVRRMNADIVHAHSSWAGVISRLARRGSAKLIYEPHCYKFDDPDVGKLQGIAFRTAEKLLAARTDVTVVLSPHEQNLALGLSPRAITHYVPNAPFLSPRPVNEISMVRRLEVVMVGRIVDQKDPEFFAELCRMVRKMDGRITFKWIGDGDETKKTLLQKAGVRVTGWLKGEEFMTELRCAGLYMHSAKYEGFPLSLLDAASLGLPILAKRISALDGTPVWQVDSIEEASRAVVEVFSMDEKRKAAYRSGQALLSVMNLDTQRTALMALYEGLEAMRPPARV